MDEHAQRLVLPVLDCLARYEAGSASLTELQAVAGATAVALDNANADLRIAPEQMDPELEEISFSVPVDEQPAAVSRAFELVRRLAAAT